MIKLQLIALQTITRKEIIRCLRIWPQTLIPPIITMALYFIIFGQIIGQRIGSINHLPYMIFITPGLVIMPIITTSFINVASSFYTAKFQHSIEELLVSPTQPLILLIGLCTGGIFRSLVIGLFLLITTRVFIDHPIAHPGLLILTTILCSLLFSMFGLINGIFANSFDDISIVPNFILTPLIFLGGVFYDINSLPPMWHFVIDFNPIAFIVQLFRFAWLNPHPFTLWIPLASLIMLNLIIGLIAYFLIANGVRVKD